MRWGRGSAPEPAGAAYSVLSDPLAELRCVKEKGERGRGRKEKGENEREGEMRKNGEGETGSRGEGGRFVL